MTVPIHLLHLAPYKLFDVGEPESAQCGKQSGPLQLGEHTFGRRQSVQLIQGEIEVLHLVGADAAEMEGQVAFQDSIPVSHSQGMLELEEVGRPRIAGDPGIKHGVPGSQAHGMLQVDSEPLYESSVYVDESDVPAPCLLLQVLVAGKPGRPIAACPDLRQPHEVGQELLLALLPHPDPLPFKLRVHFRLVEPVLLVDAHLLRDLKGVPVVGLLLRSVGPAVDVHSEELPPGAGSLFHVVNFRVEVEVEAASPVGDTFFSKSDFYHQRLLACDV